VRRLTPKINQRLSFSLIWLGGFITVMFLVIIIGYILVEGLPHISWDFLTTPPKGGLSAEGGISTIIVGTAWLVGLTMVILIPTGIGAAIYLAEYAPDNRFTSVIRYAIETLAGVPSIIFGLFGFALFVTALHFNFSILSGSLTLSCLLLPVMIRTTEEAIKTVPYSYREGAMALGATRWQTISRVVLPSAMPGIITAIILSIGRAVEETACLYVTMGSSAAMPTSLLSSGRSLSLHVYYLATDTNNIQGAMATAAVLIITIVVINGITNWLSHRYRQKLAGASMI
jgi:phosphate transport system permease protein